MRRQGRARQQDLHQIFSYLTWGNEVGTESVLAELADIGYRNIEPFGDTIEFAKTVGQKYVGSGGAASPGIGNLEDTLATVQTLNRLGERSKKSDTGKIFVHNHQGEFTSQYPTRRPASS
ncbi:MULTISPECIES: hypothetical protein [unclassified Arthrobacter]|uniref:hypothetical protein n=1 Tax=unclassified Arthrobacter TaxID=235627 RepID=UPI0011B05BD3|nr:MULTISPECIES: hypothetical protein [unclassified Arthrobacter]